MPDQVPDSTPFLPGSPEYAAALTQPPPGLREQSMAPSAGALAPPLQAPEQPQAPPMQASLPPRPIGTSGAGQPTSKAEFFRKMLGDFFYSVGTGLANRGSGPDADARGAGAAITALPNRDIMQQQLDAQREALRQKGELEKSQADALKPTIRMIGPDGQEVMVPPAHVGQALAAQYRLAGQLGAAATKSQTDVTTTGMKTGSAEKIAAGNVASKEKLAGASLDEKVKEFKTTDQYKRWKTQLDDDTKVRVADLTASKAPAAMLQTASFSQGALEQMSDAQKAMDTLESNGFLGKNLLTNKVEAYLFGHGLADPSWDANTRRLMGKMKAALGNTATATMRAHTGRTSQEIYEDYKTRFGAGQDWSALRGAMDETGTLLQHYVGAASNENIKALRSGEGGAPKGSGKLSEADAMQYLKNAGGDANKARAMAKKDGRTF